MPRGRADVQPYSFFNLGPKWGWVIKAKTLPIYVWERDPLSMGTGGWVGPKSGLGLEGCGKSRPPPTGIRSPPSIP